MYIVAHALSITVCDDCEAQTNQEDTCKHQHNKVYTVSWVCAVYSLTSIEDCPWNENPAADWTEYNLLQLAVNQDLQPTHSQTVENKWYTYKHRGPIFEKSYDKLTKNLWKKSDLRKT